MLLLKCCSQYTSKFEKLSSGHRTEKGEFSFQFQRKAMPKNVQITVQLHSFHTQAVPWIFCGYIYLSKLIELYTLNGFS